MKNLIYCYSLTIALFLILFVGIGNAQTITTFASNVSGSDLVFDNLGDLYVSGTGSGNTIREITPIGVISTVVGNISGHLAFNGTLYVAPSGTDIYTVSAPGKASVFALGINGNLAFDFGGLLVISGNNIYQINLTSGATSIFASTDLLNSPWGVASNSNYLFVSNGNTNSIVRVNYLGVATNFVNSGLSRPVGIAFDNVGNLYVANSGNNTISKITSNGVVSTFVPASAGLSNLGGMASDNAGNLYVSASGSIFKINTNGLPDTLTISSFTPTTATKGTSVNITGSNFINVTGVSFGDSAASSYIVNSTTSITAIVGGGSSGNVSVSTNNGTTYLAGFNYAKPMTIKSFSPTIAKSGQTISIIGSNFTEVTGVNFGGTASASYTVLNDSTITAIVGKGKSGSVTVTSIISSVSSTGFSYIPPPIITSFNPTSVCPNTKVTITGENFTGVTSVSFGGVAAASFTVDSSTSISALMTIGSSGTVSVTASGGTATSVNNISVGYTFGVYAYITNSTDNTVSVINTANNNVLSTIPVGKYPYGVAITNDGTKVYVTNQNDNTVSVINTATNTVISTIKVGDSPLGVCATPDNKKVYVTNYQSKTISVINSTTDTVLKTLYLGVYPDGICAAPDDSKIYVANGQVIDVTTDTIINNLGIGGFGICISPDGSKLYYTNANNVGIYGISNKTNKLINDGINSPEGICISPDGKNVYVTNSNSNTVGLLNNNQIYAVASAGANLPIGIDITPDGSKLYVAYNSSNFVSVFDILSGNYNNTRIDITVGRGPIAFGNFIGKVYFPCGFPQPVTITTLEAVNKNGSIAIKWLTSTELNTSHFIIQHSTDGASFTDIGTVKAIGSGANSYEFTDKSPTNGINYYRLQSVDKDGASTYSAVVSCEWLVVSKQFTVYPNPAKSSVTINGNHIVSVQVIDNMGRVVKVVSLKDASNPVLSVSGLQAGVYHLRIQTTDGNVSGVGFVKE